MSLCNSNSVCEECWSHSSETANTGRYMDSLLELFFERLSSYVTSVCNKGATCGPAGLRWWWISVPGWDKEHISFSSEAFDHSISSGRRNELILTVSWNVLTWVGASHAIMTNSNKQSRKLQKGPNILYKRASRRRRKRNVTSLIDTSTHPFTTHSIWVSLK